MNDSISRQDDAMNMNSEQAIHILTPMRDMMRDQYGCPISDAYFALDKAIDSLGKQKWIPCSERLPEEDGDYLVCYEEGYREDYGFPKIGIAPFEVDCEGFGIWQEEFDLHTLGSLGSEWVVIPVNAWMSLPDPYEVKSNG